MRAYFFGNMYLSSIQQGIQSAHVVAEMFTKYGETDNVQHDMLFEWATVHKTMVLLNAGYSEEIFNLVDFFGSENNHFPWACFFEGQDALCGALTSIGIILPEEIYGAAKELRTAPGYITGKDSKGMMYNGYELSQYELELAQRLNNYGLAR
jgi:hypothetical protein